MKHKIPNSLFLLLFVIAFLGCKKEDTFLFRVNIPLIDFSINSTLSVFNEHFIPGNDGSSILINIEEQFQNAGYELSEIDKIIPGSARFTVTFDDHRLDFIRAMSIRICNGIGANCGKEVFYRDPVPENAGFSMSLIPSAIDDVKDILANDVIFVQLKLEQLFSSPSRSFNIRLDMDFKVK